MQKIIVLFGWPTSAGVQSEGRQVSLYGLQLHVKQLKWNHRSPARGGRRVREREEGNGRKKKQRHKPHKPWRDVGEKPVKQNEWPSENT